jgi:iron complex transport system permease protein
VNKRRLIVACIFLVLFVASLFIGVDSHVTLANLLSFDKDAWNLFLLSRLPRTIVIILVATSISIAGMIMHALGRNKFISPSTAGTTDAAMLGILVGYLLMPNQSNIVKFVFAFVFAMLATLVFITVVNKIKFKNAIYVPLIGMMFGGVIGAIATLIAQRFQILQVMTSIGVGSFAHISVINAQLLILLVPALIIAIIFAQKFNIIALGVDFAKNLGVNYMLVMVVGLIVVSTVSASSFIVACGTKSYVNLLWR